MRSMKSHLSLKRRRSHLKFKVTCFPRYFVIYDACCMQYNLCYKLWISLNDLTQTVCDSWIVKWRRWHIKDSVSQSEAYVDVHCDIEVWFFMMTWRLLQTMIRDSSAHSLSCSHIGCTMLLSTDHYHFYSMKHLPHVLAVHYLRLCAVNVLDNSGESDPNATRSKSVVLNQRSTAEVRLYFYSYYSRYLLVQFVVHEVSNKEIQGQKNATVALSKAYIRRS